MYFTACAGVSTRGGQRDSLAIDLVAFMEAEEVSTKGYVRITLRISFLATGRKEMKSAAFTFFFFCIIGSCLAQDQPGLCPRHIETPTFPQIARVAHVTGKVILSVTIDADGNVTNAEATNKDKWVRLLKKSAIDNVRRWTFSKPPSAPYIETIVYDYEFDPSLPADGGPRNVGAITNVNFDLPDHVTLLTNVMTIETSRSKKRSD